MHCNFNRKLSEEMSKIGQVERNEVELVEYICIQKSRVTSHTAEYFWNSYWNIKSNWVEKKAPKKIQEIWVIIENNLNPIFKIY